MSFSLAQKFVTIVNGKAFHHHFFQHLHPYGSPYVHSVPCIDLPKLLQPTHNS